MQALSPETQLALDAFVTPVWLVDVSREEVAWANRAALTLFEVISFEDLLAREPMHGAGPTLLAEIARLPPGARLECDFRVTRAASELTVPCTCTGFAATAGVRLVLVEAHADRNAPASLRRAPDLEQRLQSRDRMASIGTLTAGVVHGINNPLSYVIANLEYVKRLLANGASKLDGKSLGELGEVVEDSLDGAERVRRIVSDLGNFSRPLEERALAVDLERAAERALSVAANEIKHRARVVREFGGIAAAQGNEGKLGQVILNVLINAAHSIEPGAIERNTITVRTRLDAEGRPTLVIADSGCGIAKEHLPRIFEPFFTTKPVGVGSGLGLSIAQRIVQDQGGELAIESVHGEGTTVTLTLPVAAFDAAPEPVYESVPPFSSDRVRARVLVIDDEPAILRAFRRVLYTNEVVVAASGPDAMQKLASGEAYDAIFCDVMMPEMSGVEVYQRIAERYPGQERKLVFMTGGAFSEPAAHFIGSVDNPKLKKPFTGTAVRALVAAIARVPGVRVSRVPRESRAPR